MVHMTAGLQTGSNFASITATSHLRLIVEAIRVPGWMRHELKENNMQDDMLPGVEGGRCCASLASRIIWAGEGMRNPRVAGPSVGLRKNCQITRSGLSTSVTVIAPRCGPFKLWYSDLRCILSRKSVLRDPRVRWFDSVAVASRLGVCRNPSPHDSYLEQSRQPANPYFLLEYQNKLCCMPASNSLSRSFLLFAQLTAEPNSDLLPATVHTRHLFSQNRGLYFKTRLQ